MSEANQQKPQHSEAVPPTLQKKFQALRRALQTKGVAEWISVGVVCLLLGFLLFFLLDRFVLLSRPLAFLLTLTGWLGFLVVGPLLYVKRVQRYKTPEALASLLAKTRPRFGDRLLGVLELRHQEGPFSPELREAALRHVSAQAERVDFSQALPKTWTRRCLWSCLIALSFFTLGAALQPALLRNVAVRYLFPASDLPRFTFVRFAGVPAQQIVPRGEAFTLRTALKREDQLTQPPTATATLPGQPTVPAEYEDGYSFLLQGISSPEVLTLKAGDAVKRVKIAPLPRPRLESVRAEIKLPSYLKRPDLRSTLPSGVLALVEGAEGRFLLEANRALASYSLAEVGTQRTPSFSIEENVLKSAWVAPPEEPVSLHLSLTDRNGLVSSSPRSLLIRRVPDGAPQSSLRAAKREYLLLEDESITLSLSARDDYGVKELGILWKETAGLQRDTRPPLGRSLVRGGGPTQLEMEAEFVFQPSLLQIAPQSFTLHTYALDYYPQRGPQLSAPITVHLLSAAQHAKYVHDRFDELLDQLEETLRAERLLNDENRRLARLGPESFQESEAGDRLSLSYAAEKKQRRAAQDAVEASKELFKEALRNAQISRRTKTQFARLTPQLAALLNEDYPQLLRELDSSLQNRPYPEESIEALQEGIRSQNALTEKLQQIIAEGRELDRRFEASTFVQRLSQLAKDQSKLGSELIARMEGVGGLPSASMDPADQRELGSLAANQGQIGKDLRWITEDLRHYFARSQKEEIAQLATRIESSAVREELTRLERSVQQNYRFAGARLAKQLSQTFSLWAQELGETAASLGNAGGGAGAGNQDDGRQSDEEAEFMLRVMEIIKKQQNLRGQTRAIEQLKNPLIK